MDQDNNQSRFLLAAVLSMLVLLGWTYFFAPKPTENANTNANANSASNIAANSAENTQSPPTANPTQVAANVPDQNENRSVSIKTSLFEATLDSKGAVATSWLLLKNKSNMHEYPVYADGSSEGEKKPLQLISQKALEQNPRELPFRLIVPDQNLTTFANERNYKVSVPEAAIELADGEEKRIDFTLTDGNGTEIVKSFVFRGGSYLNDLSITVKQNGVSVPDAKLAIGASIGDHAINNHNLYHSESEAIASIDDDIMRHQGNYSFTYDSNNRASLTDKGTVNWAGMGDAYFAMAAIPPAPVNGLEYKAFKYEVQTEPFYDSIFSWVIRSPKTSETRHLVTTLMPVPTDGSTTRIYTGTKDYFLLNGLTENLSATVGRSVSLVDLINFSNYWWLRWITKPLSIPILYALNFLNTITTNYGLAIIIFTFLFYSILFPLRWKQSRSFKKASVHAPKMQELQKKIKELQGKGVPLDDPRMRELQMQQLRLTKDSIPLGGCLPMLMQFPLLIAFYTAITISLEARQASFMWLPDLSAPDPWHFLEFAFAASMILSIKLMPTPAAVSPEQQMQQKMMTWVMPVMMLWVMWAAPSGLLLYWFFGNIVSFGQQMIINRMNKTNEPPATEIVESVPKNAKKVKAKLSTS